MGYTYVDTTFANPDNPGRKISVSGLVDTGTLSSMIPKKMADDLGIKPSGYNMIRTPSGRIKLGYAEVKIGFNGDEGTFRTYLNPKLDKILIGAIVLESFALKISPKTGKFEKDEESLFA